MRKPGMRKKRSGFFVGLALLALTATIFTGAVAERRLSQKPVIKVVDSADHDQVVIAPEPLYQPIQGKMAVSEAVEEVEREIEESIEKDQRPDLEPLATLAASDGPIRTTTGSHFIRYPMFISGDCIALRYAGYQPAPIRPEVELLLGTTAVRAIIDKETGYIYQVAGQCSETELKAGGFK